jgi:hypothetical protein
MSKKILFLIACASALLGLGATDAAAQATTIENVPLWRVQMRVHVCDREDAGTDDGVGVILNDQTSFRIDTAVDDLERNREYTYDIVTDSIDRVSDIDQLTIFLTGDDGFCIDRLALFINGAGPFFERSISGGRWIDSDSGTTPVYTVSGTTLRASPTWNLSGARASAAVRPTNIPRATVETMIEAGIGHVLAGNSLQWGHLYGRPVEIQPRQASDGPASQRIDLDLEYEVRYFWNPEVDVDYRADYTCTDGRIRARATNIQVVISGTGPDWIYSALTAAANLATGLFEDRLNNLGQPGFTGYVAGCPTIVAETDGDLAFTYPTSPFVFVGGVIGTAAVLR